MKESGHRKDTGKDLDISDRSDNNNEETEPGSNGPKYAGTKTRAKKIPPVGLE